MYRLLTILAIVAVAAAAAVTMTACVGKNTSNQSATAAATTVPALTTVSAQGSGEYNTVAPYDGGSQSNQNSQSGQRHDENGKP